MGNLRSVSLWLASNQISNGVRAEPLGSKPHALTLGARDGVAPATLSSPLTPALFVILCFFFFASPNSSVFRHGVINAAEDDFVISDEKPSRETNGEMGARAQAIHFQVLPQRKVNRVVPDPNGNEQQFDQWVYGVDATSGQNNLETVIRRKVGKIAAMYDLTDEQHKRLVLAAHADKSRLNREIEALKEKYLAGNADVTLTARQAMLLQHKQSTFLGDDSFFAKATNKILTSEVAGQRQPPPLPRLTPQEFDRHQRNVEDAVRSLGRHLVLQRSQRELLIKLLLVETRPTQLDGQFDDIVVKYRFAQISEEKLKYLFDNAQWPHVQEALEGFREFGPVLAHHGLIELKKSPPTPGQENARATVNDWTEPISAIMPANQVSN